MPGASSCKALAMGRPSASPVAARKLTSAPSKIEALEKRASLKWKNSRASLSAHLHRIRLMLQRSGKRGGCSFPAPFGHPLLLGNPQPCQLHLCAQLSVIP